MLNNEMCSIMNPNLESERSYYLVKKQSMDALELSLFSLADKGLFGSRSAFFLLQLTVRRKVAVNNILKYSTI